MSDGAPTSTRARPAPAGGGFGREPNPLLARELRQSMRLPRLPWQIAAVVALVGLGMLAIGSLEGPHGRSAQLGVGLFQGFITILLGYVALVGPATAAGAIASEREGKTLEPLLLTGLSPSDIARGKFLAAFGTIALQVLALFPLSAIPFLFGGVTAAELVVAVFYVLVVAAVAVAFGLAVASRAQSLRTALAVSVTLPAAAMPMAFGLLFGLGETVSRKKWTMVQASGPVWWASAYTSVPFGLDYVLWLVLWPLLTLGLPFWLFAVMTASNLAGASEDRSSGLKRWFVGATLSTSFVGFVTCFRVQAHAAIGVAIAMQLVLALLLLLAVVLFAGEPLAASRLVAARWDRTGAGLATRFVGPGLISGGVLTLACGGVGLAACLLGGVSASSMGGLRSFLGVPSGSSGPAAVGNALLVLVVYTFQFALFLVGLAAFLRARPRPATPQVVRATTIAVTVVAIVVPWLLFAIVGSFDRVGRERVFVAAPSPAYAYYAFDRELSKHGYDGDASLWAFAASTAWGALGLALFGVAWARARGLVAAQTVAQDLAQRRLDEEAEEDDDDEPEPAAPAPPPLPR